MVAVGVRVTEVPAHTPLADGAIETLTGRLGFTVMVTVLEVAGFPVAHDALDVNTQVTAFVVAGMNE